VAEREHRPILGRTSPEEEKMTIDPQTQEVRELADRYRQWVFAKDHKGLVPSKANFENPPHPQRNVNLFNTEVNLFLQYEEQTWGINLGWTNDAGKASAERTTRWFFSRRNGTGRPITYGEKVALGYGTHRSFIYYASRKFGINLDWSGPPVYEWIIAGGKRGEPVPQNTPVGIWNDKTDHFFLYFDRDIGGNIGWDDSKSWLDIIGGKLGALVDKYGESAVKYAVAYYLGVPELPALDEVGKKN
jgi:hypothetical protein